MMTDDDKFREEVEQDFLATNRPTKPWAKYRVTRGVIVTLPLGKYITIDDILYFDDYKKAEAMLAEHQELKRLLRSD